MPPTDPTSKRPASDPSEATLPTVDVGNEGAVELGDLEDDGLVEFAALPEPPSGQSLTSWTEVIRRQRATQPGTEAGQAVKVDALSDKDLLIQFDAIENPGRPSIAARRPGDTNPIPQAELPIFTPPPLPNGRSESDIDLGLGVRGTGESEVKFDILYPPSDAGGAMPAPDLAPLSGVDFRAVTPVAQEDDIPFAAEVAAGMSGVNLGSDTGPPGEGGRSSILDELLRDAANDVSGSADLLDYGSAPVRSSKPTAPAAERPTIPTRPAIELDDGAPEDDGLDLIGDQIGSEDAIDLYADPAPSPSITDSGTLEISQQALDESERRTQLQESSSVDLSSRPSLAGDDFGSDLEAPAKPARVSDSDIDLNLPPVEDEGNSSLVSGRAALDENSAVLTAEFEARRRDRTDDDSDRRPARKRGAVVPARESDAPVRSGGYLIHGGIIGLLLGAGGVLAAYFGGAMPDRHSGPVVVDNSADLVRQKETEAEAARKEAAAAKAELAIQVADAKKASVGEITQLKSDLQKAMETSQQAVAAATEAKLAADTAKTKQIDAEKVAADAKKEFDDAMKAAEAAVAAKKTAEDAVAAYAKIFKDAGIDPTKAAEDVKKLVDAKTAAETKEKDAAAKLAETTKKVTDLTAVAEAAKKSNEEARKAAEDLAKARDASDANLKAVADRLVKAKFVGDKADAAAILKGIDDAVKAGSTDATAKLRDELVEVRMNAVKADLEAKNAQKKLTSAITSLKETQAEAQKLAAENAKAKTDAAKLTQDVATNSAKAAEAVKTAADAKTIVERTSAEVARLKVENDRLTRDLDAVKELAELIKAPGTAVAGPAVKPDPNKLAEQFFGDGLRAFHGGRHTDAESAFRKAVQFRPADARFHYLLGLTLWARNDKPGAEAEFEKGRDLELAGRPSSRMIGATLERIQGQARQAVDAYRP